MSGSVKSYSQLFSWCGGGIGLAATFVFPPIGHIESAIIGAVCCGGGVALGGAVGSFFDSWNVEPDKTEHLPSKLVLSIAALFLGVVGLIAWFLPIAGLPIAIAGVSLGRAARFSQQRIVAMTAWALSLIGLLLSAGNAYLGALATVRTGPQLTAWQHLLPGPKLTAAQAQVLIQAKYDQDPPVSTIIAVSDLGIQQGVRAKYWTPTMVYPNKYWADFTLTSEGKKAIKLPNGGDVITWRPENATEKNFAVIVISTATNHLKAKDVMDPQDEIDGTKSAMFTVVHSLDGMPAPLADIAHDPVNMLSSKKTAKFELDSGAWKLHSIE
jgi:hypothetical protein